MLSLSKISNKYIIFSISIAAVVFKFSSIATLYDYQTWDGPGHKVLLNIFIKLSSQFLAEGYVDDWFGGFPAFRYYPSFFAFLGSLPFHLGFDIDTSLRLSIWLTALILLAGYYYFASTFLNIILSFSALFLYLSFQGPPTLGSSFAGIWGGNFPSLLGTGLSFFSLGSLLRIHLKSEKIDYANLCFFFFSLCLLGFTHYLNFIFTYLIVSIYIIIFFLKIFLDDSKQNKISKNAFGILLISFFALIVVLPSFYGPIFQSSESSGETLLVIYPFIENILGINTSSNQVNELLISPVKLIPLFLSVGIIFFKRVNYKYTFLILSYVCLFIISQDLSVPKILFYSNIHFYRAWDIFLGIHFIVSMIGLSQIFKKYNLENTIFALSVICLFFLGYKYKDNNFDSNIYKQWNNEISQYKFNENEYVFIEETTKFPWDHSPHKALSWMQSRKINTVNGLMVESSWTPYVNRLYIPFRNNFNFIWGHQDPYITYELEKPSLETTIEYLNKRNITKVISKTQVFDNDIQSLITIDSDYHVQLTKKDTSDSNITIHSIIQNNSNSLKKEPLIIGLIRESTILNYTDKKKPIDFFIESFKLQNEFPKDSIFIDLDAYWKSKQILKYSIPFHKVIIYSSDRFKVKEELTLKEWDKFIFDNNKRIFPNLESYKKSRDNCEANLINQSYFPDLYLDSISKNLMFRTHFNQTLVCGLEKEKLNLQELHFQFPILLGRLKFLLMIFISFFWLVSGFALFKKTNA